MSVKELLEPILEQGIRHTNYFEGRLLTGEDLRDQQNADRERDRRLGRAIGSGIIEGLEVTLDSERDGSDGSPPVVAVTKGLAINPDGEIIGLPHNDVKLALSKTDPAVEIDEADFYDCAGPPGSQHLPNGAGIYILVMSTAAGYKERAPKSGLGDGGFVKGCGSRYIQEGVQFRLLQLDITSIKGLSIATEELIVKELFNPNSPLQKTDAAALSKFQNTLAHLCFGSEQKRQLRYQEITNIPTGPVNSANDAIEQLRESGELTSCDVCLALLYWSFEGVLFLDNWAVRRLLSGHDSSAQYETVNIVSNRRVSMAAFFQFQAQIQSLIENTESPHLIQARDYFHYFPPLGVLPLVDANYKGFSVTDYFQDMTYRVPNFFEESQMETMLLQSYGYPSAQLTQDELVWLYVGLENNRSNDTGESTQQEFLVFTTGHMPFFASPRFDLSRYNYSSYISAFNGPAGF